MAPVVWNVGGVPLVLEEMRWAGGASFSLSSRLGQWDEPALGVPGGTAHLLEHMVFRSCAGRDGSSIPGEEANRFLEGLGAEPNAWTAEDHVAFEMTLPARSLEEALPRFLDMALRPLVLPGELEAERGVVLQEILEASDDPAQAAAEAWSALARSGHPLALPITGVAESVSSIRAADIRGFHARAVQPGRLVASAAGRLDPEAVARILERAGFSPGPSVPPREPPPFRPGVDAVEGDFSQAHLVLGFPAPSPGDPARSAAVLAAAVLGLGMSSRLNLELRERMGVAYSCAADLSALSPGADLTLHAAADPERAAEAARAMRLCVERAAAELGRPELDLARARVRGMLELDGDSPARRRDRNAADLRLLGRVPSEGERLDAPFLPGLDEVRSVLAGWARGPLAGVARLPRGSGTGGVVEAWSA